MSADTVKHIFLSRWATVAALAASVALVAGCASGDVPDPIATVEETPTLTTPEPPPLPDWQVIELATVQVGRASSNSTFQTADELWFSGSIQGETVLYKTTDGLAFTTQQVGRGVIEEYAQIGQTIVGVGRAESQALVHRSADGGASWQAIAPPVMKVANAEVWLESVTVHNNQFVAAGTVRAKDWHVRLWTSPDGSNWNLAGEFRHSHPTSASRIISDGSTLVLVAAEHYCSVPSTPNTVNVSGWYLGSWVDYLRIWQGSDPAHLVQQSTSENPLILDPDIDCGTSGSGAFLDDPEVLFNDAELHGNHISMIVRVLPEGSAAGYGVATLQDAVWEFEIPTELEGGGSSAPAQLFTLAGKLTAFWSVRTFENEIQKHLVWRDGIQWLSFAPVEDDQVTGVTLATEFQGRVYVWGNHFTQGGSAGDPMQWRLYRSAQIGD